MNNIPLAFNTKLSCTSGLYESLISRACWVHYCLLSHSAAYPSGCPKEESVSDLPRTPEASAYSLYLGSKVFLI